jgi:hypothetical protein
VPPYLLDVVCPRRSLAVVSLSLQAVVLVGNEEVAILYKVLCPVKTAIGNIVIYSFLCLIYCKSYN